MQTSAFRKSLKTAVRLALPLLMLLAGGCDQVMPKHTYYKYNMTAKASDSQQPFYFKARYLNALRDPYSTSRYVCDTVDSYLQDRSIADQQFSYIYMQGVLNHLPASLRQSYATCYLEQDIRREGFRAYFEDGSGFLASEALAGYQDFFAVPQAEILTRALNIAKQRLAHKMLPAQAAKQYAALDKAWRQTHHEQLLLARGSFMQRTLSAGAWPISDEH